MCEAGRKDFAGKDAGSVAEDEVEKAIDEAVPDAPCVSETLRLFGSRFREALASG